MKYANGNPPSRKSKTLRRIFAVGEGLARTAHRYSIAPCPKKIGLFFTFLLCAVDI